MKNWIRNFLGQKRPRTFRFSSVIETLIFLSAVVITNQIFFPEYHGFLNVAPHPFWAIVILIAIRYGFKEGLLCAGLAGATYAAFVLFPKEGTYYFLTINLFSDFKMPLLFLFTGGVISGYTEHLIRRTEILRQRLAESRTEARNLEEKNQATLDALNKLELRIASQFNSMVDLFGALALTKQLPIDDIKQHLLKVLTQYLQVEQCVYYDLERGHLIRRFSFPESASNSSNTPDEDFILTEALRTNQMASLGHFAQRTDMEQYRGSSLLAGPVINSAGETVGIVGVEKIPFLEYHPHNFKLFETILTWWGHALEERLKFDEFSAKSIYNEELGVFNYTYFQGRIEQEFQRAKRFSLPISFALFKIEYYENVPIDRCIDLRQTLAQILSQHITELEMISGYASDDTIAITLPFMMAADAEKRLQKISEKIEAFQLQPYNNDDFLRIRYAVGDYQIGMETCTELIAEVEKRLNAPIQK